jgi:hypothetical protein
MWLRLYAKVSKRKQLILLFLVFFVYLLSQFFPDGIQSDYLGEPASSSPKNLIPVLGLSDSGNYLKAAIDIQDFQIQEENKWIFNLWPPGQVILLALFVKLSVPPVLGMGILFCFLWALAAVMFIQTINLNRGNLPLIIMFCAAWLTGAPLLGWNQKEGALGSDGISTALASIFVITLITLKEKINVVPLSAIRNIGILLGLLLAIISYLRFIFLFAVLFSALVILFHPQNLKPILLRMRRSKMKRVNGPLIFQKIKKLYLVTSTIFLLLTLPFTLIKIVSTGSPSWSSADYVWGQKWMSDEILLSNNANFLIQGGSNWACKIDTETCNQIIEKEVSTEYPFSGYGEFNFAEFRNLAFLSAIKNPISFVENRAKVVFQTFETLPGASIGDKNNQTKGILLLFSFMFIFFSGLLFFRMKSVFDTFIVLFCLGLFLPLIFEHFESRYLIPIQAISILYILSRIRSFDFSIFKKYV